MTSVETPETLEYRARPRWSSAAGTGAYRLAALWALYSGNEIAVDVPHMDIWVRRLAKKVIAFNNANPSGAYECDPADLQNIQVLMQASRNGTQINERLVQRGLSQCEKPKAN